MKTIKSLSFLALLSFAAIAGYQSPLIAGVPSCPITFSPNPGTGFVDIETYWQITGSKTSPADLALFQDAVLTGNATVLPGTYLGWCIDVTNGIDDGPENYNVLMYSSCDPNLDTELAGLGYTYHFTYPLTDTNDTAAQWNALNYLLNHKLAGASYWDVQAAIWSFIGGPLPSDDYFTINGYPAYSSNNVNLMVQDTLSNSPAWAPQCGDVLAVVLAITSPDSQYGDFPVQLTILEVPVPCQCLTITNLPAGQNFGCNGSNSVPNDTTVLSGVTVIANCCSLGSLSATHVDTSNGCFWTRTFTITATSPCATNSANVVYTWINDTTGPVFAGVPAGGYVGCGTNNVPTSIPGVTATATCGSASIMVTSTDTSNQCMGMRTFTFTAYDDCTNSTTNVVYTWTLLTNITVTKITTNITPQITITTNSCTNEICGNFNSQGSGAKWVWFSAHVSSKPNQQLTFYCQNAIITLACQDGKTYAFAVPNGQINFSPTTTVGTNWFDGTQWHTTLPTAGDDEIFLQGLAIPWQADFANCQSVCWTGVFSCSVPGFSCNWQWGAACYGNSLPPYGSIAPKACHQTPCPNGLYYNAGDHAGTPENEVPYVVAGGTGGGGGNTTGSWSATSTTCTSGGIATNITYITNYSTNITATTAGIPPVLIGVPPGQNLGLNPANIPTVSNILADVSASDTCSPAPVGVTAVESTNDCAVTQIFTISATNDCGASVVAYVTNTWTTCTTPSCPCNPEAIQYNFNGTQIIFQSTPGGSYVWFISDGTVKGLPSSPVTLHISDQSITIPATGKSPQYTVPVPDSWVTFSPSITVATATFTGGAWYIDLPTSGLAGNVFYGGAAFAVPAAGLPGGIQNVLWSGKFTTATPGLSINWQWHAAAYSEFTSNYTLIDLKPVDDNKASIYQNSDDSGTPEGTDPLTGKAWKNFVEGGASGGGGANYTGSGSSTISFPPCVCPNP